MVMIMTSNDNNNNVKNIGDDGKSRGQKILQEFQIDNCRVCIDIKQWRKKAQRLAQEEMASVQGDTKIRTVLGGAMATASLLGNSEAKDNISDDNSNDNRNHDTMRECPPDKEELGKSTWTFLHTMAAYYPNRPTLQEQTRMNDFIRLFSHIYPCSPCAEHLQMQMKERPPQVESRESLMGWWCWMHNQVNELLGKPIFDCSRLEERWHTGPSDGSCD